MNTLQGLQFLIRNRKEDKHGGSLRGTNFPNLKENICRTDGVAGMSMNKEFEKNWSRRWASKFFGILEVESLTVSRELSLLISSFWDRQGQTWSLDLEANYHVILCACPIISLTSSGLDGQLRSENSCPVRLPLSNTDQLSNFSLLYKIQASEIVQTTGSTTTVRWI